MGRKPTPARVKRVFEDGSVLYAWRDAVGGAERTGKGPGGEANLLAFQSHVLASWDAGSVPMKPSQVLVTASASGVEQPGPTIPTVSDWVGTIDAPGRFFAHTVTRLKRPGMKRYVSLISNPDVAGLIGTKRLDHVSIDDAEAVLDALLACPRCLERGLTARAARADNCVPECMEHLPKSMRRRRTAQGARTMLGAVFNAAQRAGMKVSNPFAGRTIGQWTQPASEDDHRTALTIPQFHQLLEAHPPELRVVPAVSVYGMLRQSEMWGLQRQDFPVPPADPADDPESITFRLMRVWNQAEKCIVEWGKNPGSTKVSVALPANGAKILNAHLRRNNQPNGNCTACAAGKGLWRGPLNDNPHSGCGWANDALLVPLTLCRPRHYSRSVSRRAQQAAGLDTLPFSITHRSFRSTGATMHLRAGTHLHEVVQMGRWTNSRVLLQTYFRLYGEAYADATARLDRSEAAELGLDQTDAAPLDGRLRFLRRKIEALEATASKLAAENDDLRNQLGLDPRPADGEITAVAVRVRPSKWEALSDAELTEVILRSHSQRQMLIEIGVKAATKNYRTLRARADALGLSLPPPWGRKTGT